MAGPLSGIRKLALRAWVAVLVPFVNWFYARLYVVAGGENRPVFFDIAKTAPSLAELDRHYPEIRAEVERLLGTGVDMPTYHDLDDRQKYISGASKQKWKVFMLYAMGAKPEANRQQCPKTVALLDKVPHLFQAFFSILEPGKSVPAHNGPFPGYIRYHLGLIVPATNPPKIRVKDQMYTWREGESVLFDDTWNHEVYNQSDGPRVILLVDIMRPLPTLLHAINVFYSKAVLRLGYASGVMKNAERFR
jgi:aspartyl/asparaginyl beta-hydroxylase (cupin superfamily)